MANSSKVPMFDHKTLNEDLPVGKPFCDKPHVAVIGAANDFVVVWGDLLDFVILACVRTKKLHRDTNHTLLPSKLSCNM